MKFMNSNKRKAANKILWVVFEAHDGGVYYGCKRKYIAPKPSKIQ